MITKRICCICKEEKEFSEFGKDKHSKHGYTSACKNCRNYRYKKFYRDNPEKKRALNLRLREKRKEYYKSGRGIESSRRSHLKRNFGITLEDYNQMSETQNHVCAICGSKEMDNKNKVLTVDHCHNTGKIRGLLCGQCNMGMGSLKDSIELLKKSIIYLKKYNS